MALAFSKDMIELRTAVAMRPPSNPLIGNIFNVPNPKDEATKNELGGHLVAVVQISAEA